MYIDKSRYSISHDGIVTLLSGTTFAENEIINILLVRRYDSAMSILSVLGLR